MASKNKRIEAYMSALNGTTKIQYSFWPKSGEFIRPHIIRIRDSTIWIGEVLDHGGVIWRFDIKENSETVKLQPAELYALPSSTNGDRYEDANVENSFFINVLIFASISVAGFVAFMRYRNINELNLHIDRTVC